MQFDLSDEQKQLRDQIGRLLGESADAAALTGGAEAIADAERRITAGLVDMGITTMMVPEEGGGLGLGLLDLVVVAEALGAYAAPTAVLSCSIAAWAVATRGGDGQRSRWLQPLLSGQARAALALCEASGRWAPRDWSASAGDAPLLKLYVEGAAQADLIVVGVAGGLALADASRCSVEATASSPMDPTRPWANLFIPADALEPLPGLSPDRFYDALLVLSAADAAGAGQRAFEMAVEYAKTRSQFDRIIGSFQALKHQLANMASEVEPLRYLCWQAAHLWDTASEGAPRMAALAKAHATDVAVKTARASVEAHGGIGYTWEYPLHVFLKRAMHDRAALCSPARLRERAAELAGW